ncbi:alpha/beta hydrolase [Halosquirtibacter xylanolyticus]|uniref:alpha/beta fold hydrolase n=1 Tax=Halosquirtibacter xylanolyticus TaxID=3374599 RepID=UPI00374A65A7|nr:alpha/beta hydrolase [Prolixibacteraceae bacterium]
MKKISYLLSIISLTLLVACGGGDKTAEKVYPKATFEVTNAAETMPVWIHGKENSDFILLPVHGGPGSDVLDFRTYKGGDGFKAIEKNHMVAYWQQRASGASKGSDDKKHFTIAQYVDDLDKVIDQLKDRYPGKKIVLLGHSWGGMLTSSYLKDAAHKDKIVAWIDAGGVTNGTTLMEQTKADVLKEAETRVAKKENTKYWETVISQIKSNKTNANALAYQVTQYIPEVLIKVDNHKDFAINQRGYLSNSVLFNEILKTDNTQKVSAFAKPILTLWGKYDFAVSASQKKEVEGVVDANQITNIVFPASGHYMMFHEPALFAKSINDFIKTIQ